MSQFICFVQSSNNDSTPNDYVNNLVFVGDYPDADTCLAALKQQAVALVTDTSQNRALYCACQDAADGILKAMDTWGGDSRPASYRQWDYQYRHGSQPGDALA